MVPRNIFSGFRKKNKWSVLFRNVVKGINLYFGIKTSKEMNRNLTQKHSDKNKK